MSGDHRSILFPWFSLANASYARPAVAEGGDSSETRDPRHPAPSLFSRTRLNWYATLG